eukprot:Skav218003  [mRNA]  locus=scaffold2344:83358:83949:- [translate_table: standard]
MFSLFAREMEQALQGKTPTQHKTGTFAPTRPSPSPGETGRIRDLGHPWCNGKTRLGSDGSAWIMGERTISIAMRTVELRQNSAVNPSQW